jgi:hypothetical protein
MQTQYLKDASLGAFVKLKFPVIFDKKGLST